MASLYDFHVETAGPNPFLAQGEATLFARGERITEPSYIEGALFEHDNNFGVYPILASLPHASEIRQLPEIKPILAEAAHILAPRILQIKKDLWNMDESGKAEMETLAHTTTKELENYCFSIVNNFLNIQSEKDNQSEEEQRRGFFYDLNEMTQKFWNHKRKGQQISQSAQNIHNKLITNLEKAYKANSLLWVNDEGFQEDLLTQTTAFHRTKIPYPDTNTLTKVVSFNGLPIECIPDFEQFLSDEDYKTIAALLAKSHWAHYEALEWKDSDTLREIRMRQFQLHNEAVDETLRQFPEIEYYHYTAMAEAIAASETQDDENLGLTQTVNDVMKKYKKSLFLEDFEQIKQLQASLRRLFELAIHPGQRVPTDRSEPAIAARLPKGSEHLPIRGFELSDSFPLAAEIQEEIEAHDGILSTPCGLDHRTILLSYLDITKMTFVFKGQEIYLGSNRGSAFGRQANILRGTDGSTSKENLFEFYQTIRHESAHLWLNQIKQTSSSLYERLYTILKGRNGKFRPFLTTREADSAPSVTSSDFYREEDLFEEEIAVLWQHSASEKFIQALRIEKPNYFYIYQIMSDPEVFEKFLNGQI